MKPLDELNSMLEKQVLVKLKNDIEVRGVLKAFDIHINIVLDEAEYTEKDVTKKVGRLFVRGDMILFIS
jgi:small nuclear ribonucleoprotein